MVRVEGIEPPRLAAGDFESPASTSSAIPARQGLFAQVGSAGQECFYPYGTDLAKRAAPMLKGRPVAHIRDVECSAGSTRGSWPSAAGRPRPTRSAPWRFAESSFFPVPPDAMLVPMAVSRPDRVWLYATIATVALGPRRPGRLRHRGAAVRLPRRVGHPPLRPAEFGRDLPGFLCPVRPLGHPAEGADADPLQARHDHVGLRPLQPVLVHGAVDRHPGRPLLHPGRAARPLRGPDPRRARPSPQRGGGDLGRRRSSSASCCSR